MSTLADDHARALRRHLSRPELLTDDQEKAVSDVSRRMPRASLTTRRGSTSSGHRSARLSGAHITPLNSSDASPPAAGVGGYASPKLGDARGVEEEKLESKMTLKSMEKMGLVTRSSVF